VSGASAADLLRALASACDERRLRWYVFGAQAVVAHGRPRLTADVDAVVEAGRMSARELAEWLQRFGFDLRFPLGAGGDERRLLPLVYRPLAMPLDLVIAGPGLDEELLERAVVLDLGGVCVPVISAEDLVALKILAGRRKDLDDVRGILAEKGAALDLERVRDLVRALERAAERPLLARLERLLRAARARG
jgi:hypothetical protein